MPQHLQASHVKGQGSTCLTLQDPEKKEVKRAAQEFAARQAR